MWYENTDGARSFGSPRVIADDVPDASSLHVADLDGDGDLDVLNDLTVTGTLVGGGSLGDVDLICFP